MGATNHRSHSSLPYAPPCFTERGHPTSQALTPLRGCRQVVEPEQVGAGLLHGFGGRAFSTAPKAMHSAFCLIALVIVVVGMPWYHTRVALREGVSSHVS